MDGAVAPGGETAPLLRRVLWPDGGPMTPRSAPPPPLAGAPVPDDPMAEPLLRIIESADKKKKERGEKKKERAENIRAELERAASMPPVAPPTFDMAENRVRVIKDGDEARFTIEDNPDADDSPRPWRIGFFGRFAVREHDPIIARVSEDAGVDPDLVRAIMYVEAADGHYLKGGWLADKLEWSDTIEPMNVHREVWDGMAGVPASRFDDPEENIKVGAEILKRIEARLDKKDRTVEKIATIYNSTGRERVSGYGARVARAYRERPWEKDR
ncbi:MAG: lytic transglycosylase domain-containing protein [Rhodospirillaceae bacterium]|nr:lytic transglycosylase domain-containing protein [Rhodospirillaceae bacterium]